MTEKLKVPYCPKCGERRDGTFCWLCGGLLEEGLSACSNPECTYKNIWPHEKFCRECGLEIKRP